MVPIDSSKINFKSHYAVLLEGKVIGHISKSIAEQVATELRLLKIEGVQLPKLMEIVLVPDKQVRFYYLLHTYIWKMSNESHHSSLLFPARMVNIRAFSCLLGQRE